MRATFFVTGREVEQHPAEARRIVEAGHALGNHSTSHRAMVLKSPSFFRRETVALVYAALICFPQVAFARTAARKNFRVYTALADDALLTPTDRSSLWTDGTSCSPARRSR